MDLLIRYNTTLWKYHDLGLLAGYSGSLYDSDSFDATKVGDEFMVFDLYEFCNKNEFNKWFGY